MAAKRPRYSETVVKALFAMSRNVCAFVDVGTGRACEETLTDPQWKRVKAEIAHIRGLLPTSARYDADYEDPNGFENLCLLCPTHHTQIDDLEPERYTVEVLLEMKNRGLERAQSDRLNQIDFEGYAKQLIAQTLQKEIAEALGSEDEEE